MKSYTYTARDRTGSRHEGMLAANSDNEALEILHQRHLTPIEIHETLARGGRKRKTVHHGRIRSGDLGAVCWQLSTMLEGGLTITTALEIIAEDTDNLRLRHILQQTLTKVSEGKLLSDGLSAFPHVFNRLALAIVIAGETSGDLGQALRTLAEYFDSRDRIAKKVRSAIAYPIFVLVLITGIVTSIMTLIVPRFQMIFAQIGGTLPAFTRAFMGFYDLLCHNALYVVIVIAGVPVLEVFEILRGMSANDVIISAIARVKQHVMGGSNVALGMTVAGFFPNMVIRMAQVGEESGSLPMILRKTSTGGGILRVGPASTDGRQTRHRGRDRTGKRVLCPCSGGRPTGTPGPPDRTG